MHHFLSNSDPPARPASASDPLAPTSKSDLPGNSDLEKKCLKQFCENGQCEDKYRGTVCSEDRPFCDVYPFEKVYKGKDSPGCCLHDINNDESLCRAWRDATVCSDQDKLDPPKRLCSEDSLRRPSRAQWKNMTTWEKDGCREKCQAGNFCPSTCGGASNPRGEGFTGDGILLVGDGFLKGWSWTPQRVAVSSAQPVSPSGVPTSASPLTFELRSAGFYDNGVCVGQMASMKPHLRVSLTKAPAELRFGAHLFFDACTDYLFTSDNIGVSLIPLGNPPNTPASQLNGTYEYTIDASWPDQSKWLWGVSSCQEGHDMAAPSTTKEVSAAKAAFHPTSCQNACGSNNSFVMSFETFGQPQCACMGSTAKDSGLCLASFDQWTEISKQKLPGLPIWTVGYDSKGGVPLSWSSGNPSQLVQAPRPKEVFFSYVEQQDAAKTNRGLLLFGAQEGRTPVDRSPCIQVPHEKWVTAYGMTQYCSFATLICREGGVDKIILRVKAGSDPNGYGTSVYLMPYFGPRFIDGVTAEVAVDEFTSSKQGDPSPQKGGILVIRGKYNDPSMIKGDPSKTPTFETRLTVKELRTDGITFECSTTLSGMLDTGDPLSFQHFNLMQLSSNAVRDVLLDSQLSEVDNTSAPCKYPSVQKESVLQESCDHSCRDICQQAPSPPTPSPPAPPPPTPSPPTPSPPAPPPPTPSPPAPSPPDNPQWPSVVIMLAVVSGIVLVLLLLILLKLH